MTDSAPDDGGRLPVTSPPPSASLPSPSTQAAVVHPPRVLGFFDLVMFYVVTGISLRWIATAATVGPSAIVIWLGAWLAFYVPLALSVIELSSRYPQEGGLYVWTKRAFGDLAGFMAAWTYWTSNLPYFPAVLYFAASNALFIRARQWERLSDNTGFYVWFSVIALAIVTIMNVVGLDVGKWLHNVGAVGMWAPAMIVIVMGLVAWHRFGSATHFTLAGLLPSAHIKDMIFWSTIVFALAGCETASFMGGEIKDARRTIPRALLLGGVIVTFSYIVGTVCVLLALPRNEVSALQGLMQAITRTAVRIGFFGIIPIAAALIAISNLGAASAYLAAVARLPFVAGLDRFLPAIFGRLHPRWGTPYVALLVQGICGVVFVFLGQLGTSVKGAYDVLVSMGIITYFIPYLFLFAAMLRLQGTDAAADVIRVPGGKPVAILVSSIGFTTTSLTIALSLLPSPEEINPALAVTKIVGLTAILLAIGGLLYWSAKRRLRRKAISPVAAGNK